MAAPNSQYPTGSGSGGGSKTQNVEPVNLPRKDDIKEDSITAERRRLAVICKAYEEEYLKEERERFKKYEADMRQELLVKYFSDKDIFGDPIFEETGIDGIRAGRWLGTESYADPVGYLKMKKELSKSAAKPSSGQTTNGFTDIQKKNTS